MGLSTHILDTTVGRPAAGVEVLLEKHHGSEWRPLARGMTDADGRCKTLLGEHGLETATYRLRFFTGFFYKRQDIIALHPWIDITFDVHDAGAHYHIPLLLTPNSYTTYRGS